MMSTDVFEIRLGQNVDMFTNQLCHLQKKKKKKKKRFVSM